MNINNTLQGQNCESGVKSLGKKVSVIIPVRNEGPHLHKCLSSLLKQTYPATDYEVIVVDGRSSDRSRDIVDEFRVGYPNLQLLDNPAGIAPTAMNIGIRQATGDVIVRADGHNVYPPDYVENCVRYLDQTGADNVGGPWITVAPNESLGARLVAALLSSPFGVGNASYRTSAKEGFVDTVPFGAFRRELFDRIGLYNEKLVRNQDIDLNARIREAGGKIYLTPALSTYYHPVTKFSQLLRVTFRNNLWHLFTLRENAHSLEFRHVIPAMFVCGILLLSLLSPFSHLALFALMAVLVIYLLTGAYFALRYATSFGFAALSILPFAFLAFHLVYGFGILAGSIYLVKRPSAQPIRPGMPIGANPDPR
jgi:glycosyltransferase involved in cell wall biosynthesis